MTQGITHRWLALPTLLLALVGLAVVHSPAIDANEAPKTASKTPPPTIAFLKQHCVDCHGPDVQEGRFRADTIDAQFNTKESLIPWGRVIARLEAGEMPPPDNPQPNADQTKKFLLNAKTQLAHAGRKLYPSGRVRIRRLNRLEYENTVQDLLGIDTPLQDLLPPDDLADGFNNASSALSISPVHIQQYMAAADLALKNTVPRFGKPKQQTHVFSYADDKEKPFWNHPNNRIMIRMRNKSMYFYTDTHIEVPAFLRQFSTVTRQQPGTYTIRITASAHDSSDKTLFYNVWTARGNKRRDLIGHYDALPNKPTTIEITRPFAAGDSIIIAPYRMEKHRVDAGLSVYHPQKDLPKDWKKTPEKFDTLGPAIQIHPVEIQGPLYPQWPTKTYQSLFGATPMISHDKLPKGTVIPKWLDRIHQRVNDKWTGGDTPQPTGDPVASAKKLLHAFTARAFRRPVHDDDIAPYLDMVKSKLDRNECFETSLLAGYQAILCSPEFLFLIEEPGKLSDHALACRLSYFLWRSMPDATLRKLADNNQLHQPEILRQQTDRLLNSPKSSVFLHDFLDHWLNLREINATTPDRLLFPEYFTNLSSGTIDSLLHQSVVDETQAYLADLMKNNGSVTKLIDSDYTFLNRRLAEHYKIPNVDGAKLRKVKLPANSERGGILTHASILKVTANGANTSPVVRGAWILERITGRPAPPPPPDAGSIEPDTRGATTIREQLAKHKNDDSCAGCHRKIDPPGFALEAFDPIGQYRTFYRATETGKKLDATFFQNGYRKVKYLRGAQVDASGQTTTGRTFSTPQQYKKILLQDPELIARNLAEKLATFATGQHTGPQDFLTLDQIVAQTKKQQYGLRSLIHQVIQSELFTCK